MSVCFVSEEGYWGQQLLEDHPLHPFTKHPHLRFQKQLFHYSLSIVPLQVGGDGCRALRLTRFSPGGDV